MKEANLVGSDGTKMLIYVEHEDIGGEDGDWDGDDGVLDGDVSKSHVQLLYTLPAMQHMCHMRVCILMIVRSSCALKNQFGNIVLERSAKEAEGNVSISGPGNCEVGIVRRFSASVSI